MNAFGILLMLIGIFVFVNAINGNLPGLVNGTVQFNTPGSGETAAQIQQKKDLNTILNPIGGNPLSAQGPVAGKNPSQQILGNALP